MELDYSNKALMDRGKYLTEVIDKLDGKASYKDIEELPDGKIIVPWSPSAGKTTAIRQFIVRNLTTTSGVFSTKLIEDIDKIKYDIIAQSLYLNSIPIELSDKLVRSITSKDEYEIQSVRLANWVICSHERLFIEPSSLLFMKDSTYLTKVNSIDDIVRKYLFIDEYPTSLYKSFRTRDLFPLVSLDDKNNLSKLEDQATRMSIRNSFINEVYENYDNPKYVLDVGLVSSIPTPTNQSIDKDCTRGIECSKSIISKDRLCFFSNVLAEKLIEMREKEDYSDTVYYSVEDLPPKNIYLFDGTGDIILKESKRWSECNNKFKRTLSISNNEINLVSTSSRRKDSVEDIISEYTRIIDEILSTNTDSKLLVYLWKDSKSPNDKCSLISSLEEYYDTSKVRFISYQSGRERVTSEFSDSDIAIILGSFYIPTHVVSTLNSITKSSTTVADYTISLLIQFLYRSRARHGKCIKLYIDSKYKYIIDNLAELLNIKFYNLVEFKTYNDEDKLTINNLLSLPKSGVTKSELANCLGYSTGTKIEVILNRIKSLGLSVEVDSLSYRYNKYKINES